MRICSVQNNPNGYSTTFIREKIKRIPADIIMIYGHQKLKYSADGKPLMPVWLIYISRFISKVFWLPPHKIHAQLYRKLPNFLRDKFVSGYLKKHKIDLVLVEYGKTAVNFMGACERAKIPFIVHFHGYDAYKHEVVEKYRSRYKQMFQKASGIIAVSKDMVQQLVSLEAPKEKISCIPSGANTSLFTEAMPDKSGPIFVSVGRFVEKKAPYLTLLAFKKVHDRYPQAKLVFAGDGPLLEICKEMSKAFHLEASVTFRGAVKHGEVAEIMRMARAFVLHCIRPANGDCEGTPNVIIEASASALPVVSTQHAGIKDVVVHGETGFLVKERDIDSMAIHMRTFLERPDLAAKLGRAGRKRIIENFTIEKSVEKVTQLIERVVQTNQ